MDTHSIRQRAAMLESLRNSERMLAALPLIEQAKHRRYVRELRHSVWHTANVIVPPILFRRVLSLEASLLNYVLRKEPAIAASSSHEKGEDTGNRESDSIAPHA